MIIPILKPTTTWTKATIGENTDRNRTVTPGIQHWFKEFAEFIAHYQLVIHCGICRLDVPQPRRAWAHWGECAGYKPPLGDDSGSSIIKTVDGILWAGKKRAEQIELRAGQMEWLRQAEDVLAHFTLGLHCAKCDADVAGRNADSDSVYVAACKCREFVGGNRDYVEPTPLVVN